MTIKQRNLNVDLIRTLAIFLMVIFHFIYDLKYFGWITSDIPNGDGWGFFRRVILTLFFICVGIGLFYSHSDKINWQGFLKRLTKIAIGAAIITIMSLLMFPEKWVFFGVLHCIFISSLCAIFFVPYPKVSLVIGLSIIAVFFLDIFDSRWPISYISQDLPRSPVDYVALIPWSGVALLGIYLGHSKLLNRDVLKLKRLNEGKWGRRLTWPGKHSLVIYLVHQPLLFAILILINWFLNY